MLDIHAARDRAVRRAIETGHMPNLDLIHTIQRTEGYHQCFGRCVAECPRAICRWHTDCMALVRFIPKPTMRPVVKAPRPSRLRQPLPAGLGTYRDGQAPVEEPEVVVNDLVDESIPRQTTGRSAPERELVSMPG